MNLPLKSPPPNQQSTSVVKFESVPEKKGQRVVIYGPGGIGKTLLACLAHLLHPKKKCAMLDRDESIAILKTQLAALEIPIPLMIPGANSWKDSCAALRSSGWDSVGTIIDDTITRADELSIAHTLATVKGEKDKTCTSIEGYGYGKGFQHNFDTFLPLLGIYDQHIRAGRNVILIAHDCVATVPNPGGEDWIRYEPRLQNPASGKASIRLRLKEWADHVLFLGYDVASKDGKAKGSGSRTLYTAEQPWCMAKSRTTSELIVIEHGVSPWDQIIK